MAPLAEQAALAPALTPDARTSASISSAQVLLDAGLLRRADEVVGALRADPDTSLRADVLAVAAQLHEKHGELEASLETWMTSLHGSSRAPDPQQEVIALANCAELNERLGRSAAALDYCQLARDAAVRLGHDPLRGIVGVFRARVAMNTGRLDEARARLDEAVPDVQDVPRYAVDHSIVSARLTHRSGRPGRGDRQYREALADAQALGMFDRMAQFGAEAAARRPGDVADWSSAATAAQRAADVCVLNSRPGPRPNPILPQPRPTGGTPTGCGRSTDPTPQRPQRARTPWTSPVSISTKPSGAGRSTRSTASGWPTCSSGARSGGKPSSSWMPRRRRCPC